MTLLNPAAANEDTHKMTSDHIGTNNVKIWLT